MEDVLAQNRLTNRVSLFTSELLRKPAIWLAIGLFFPTSVHVEPRGEVVELIWFHPFIAIAVTISISLTGRGRISIPSRLVLEPSILQDLPAPAGYKHFGKPIRVPMFGVFGCIDDTKDFQTQRSWLVSNGFAGLVWYIAFASCLGVFVSAQVLRLSHKPSSFAATDLDSISCSSCGGS